MISYGLLLIETVFQEEDGKHVCSTSCEGWVAHGECKYFGHTGAAWSKARTRPEACKEVCITHDALVSTVKTMNQMVEVIHQ